MGCSWPAALAFKHVPWFSKLARTNRFPACASETQKPREAVFASFTDLSLAGPAMVMAKEAPHFELYPAIRDVWLLFNLLLDEADREALWRKKTAGVLLL